tara:strand:+ start:1342 stop:1587 length:246 start_codon:yes stop_codon:yes gene_type:complete
MTKWVVVINQNSGLGRMAFNDEMILLKSMKAVVEAAQLWDMSRFTQWVRNAKAGQWIEMRDTKNNVRALVIRSSDPKGWWA